MPAATLRDFLEELNACRSAKSRVGSQSFELAWNTTDRYPWLLWVGTKVGLDAEVAAAKAEIEATVDRKSPLRARVMRCCEIARKHLPFATVWQAALDAGLVAG